MKQCENISPLTEIQKFSFLDFLIKKLYFLLFLISSKLKETNVLQLFGVVYSHAFAIY